MRSFIRNKTAPFFDAVSKGRTLDLAFILFLVLFLLDNVVNFFFDIPVFVAGTPFLMCLFAPFVFKNFRKDAVFLTGLAILFLLVIINSLKDTFHLRNISDFIFLALFVISFFTFSKARESLKSPLVYVFVFASLLLFLGPALVDLTADALGPKGFLESYKTENFFDQGDSSGGRLSDYDLTEKKEREHSEFNEVFTTKYFDFEYSKEEEVRVYQKGFFRISHVASYFFGFSALFFAFLARRRKRTFFFIPAVLLLFLSLYTGSRSFLAVLTVAVLIYLVQKRYVKYVIAFLLAGITLFVLRHEVLALLDETFLYQHFSWLVTLAENFGRLSRIMIWYTWYLSISDFQWYELIIGKAFFSGIEFNKQMLGLPIWFHSDYLSLFYTYGILGLSFYIYFLRTIYKKFAVQIKGNFFIQVFFTSSVLIAFVNGFYYYFPVFLMYIFLLMIKLYEAGPVQNKCAAGLPE